MEPAHATLRSKVDGLASFDAAEVGGARSMRNLARFATIFSILTAAPPGAFAQQRPPGDGDQKRNENRGPVAISSIGFEEGPNNTVISITTSETPTFTVFKLVDPVRLLVDVAGGDVTVTTPRVQVRNGVIHDIETAQFASQGKTIGRIVIGFDVEASYSVKTDGNTIRIVVDGAERMSGKLGDAQSAELVKKAQAAIEAEKQLREELLAARSRETTLVESERSAKNALEQLQAELDRVAADSKRLQGLLDDVRSGRESDSQLSEAATRKAEEQRKTLEAAAEAARQKVAALSAEQEQLEAERAALKRAVNAAEKRKVELSNALSAEEARREAARRSRQEEEQLAAAAKAARVAEETRIEALRDAGSAEADKNAALAKATKDAEQLRLDSAKSATRVAELETALAAAKKAEGAVGKTSSKLEAELEKVKRERDLAVKAADKAKRDAELDLSEKADMHASALERVRAANDNLEAQLADQKKQATLAERAKRTFEEKLEESARAIEALKRRDDERLEAEAEVARLQKERVQSAQRARDLERDNKALLSKAERLEAEKKSLEQAVASGRKVDGIEDALASQTAELARIKGAIEAARGERTEATRSREAAEKESDAVGVKLARERADLAAVLQQKDLFSKEIATLRDRRDSLSRDASAEEQRLQTAQVRLKRLEGERSAAEEKVATLRQEVARLEGARREEGSRDTLEDRLAAKNGEIAAKKTEIAALQKALSAEKTSGQEALSERDKRLNAALENARAEARKSEEGQKKLAQIEKFLASQRAEIDKLRSGDKSGALAQKERELASLEKELAAARAQNEKSGPAVLQTARAELKAAESRLGDLETQLAREQKARTAAEQDLADARGQIGTLEADAKVGKTELASAKRRIEELTRLSADASGEVERLEKKLAASRADSDGGKAIADELAEAKIALRRAEKRLGEEQHARAADEKEAVARVHRLEGEKDTLKAKIIAQERALATASSSGDSEKELARARQKIAELSRDLTIARVQSKQSGEIERLQAEKAKLQAELARREKVAPDGVELAKLRQELAAAKSAEKSLEADLAEARQNRTEAAELARLSKAVRAAEARAETAEARAEDAEEAGQKTREALNAAEARAHSAESAGQKTREALSAAEARAHSA
ncbi:MAG: AMIN domain-containing protein, partial [Myxococcales bacterium]|nr:AMIN domain-containing protein [Myxococcales bacterium]